MCITMTSRTLDKKRILSKLVDKCVHNLDLYRAYFRDDDEAVLRNVLMDIIGDKDVAVIYTKLLMDPRHKETIKNKVAQASEMNSTKSKPDLDRSVSIHNQSTNEEISSYFENEINTKKLNEPKKLVAGNTNLLVNIFKNSNQRVLRSHKNVKTIKNEGMNDSTSFIYVSNSPHK